jgi:hypothetical protein
MVSQTGHTFDILYWTYASVLKKHDISVLQYAILRRARHDGTPYTLIVAATGVPKVTVWRQAIALANRGIVWFEAPEGKKPRTHVIGFTEKGYRLLRQIGIDVEQELLRIVGAKEYRSRRVFVFTRRLWRVNWFLPGNALGDLKSFRQSRLYDDSQHPLPFVPLSEDDEDNPPPSDDGNLPY